MGGVVGAVVLWRVAGDWYLQCQVVGVMVDGRWRSFMAVGGINLQEQHKNMLLGSEPWEILSWWAGGSYGGGQVVGVYIGGGRSLMAADPGCQ